MYFKKFPFHQVFYKISLKYLKKACPVSTPFVQFGKYVINT